jgi:asparagine synthase (glutamine-hydrolysing)
MITKVLYRGNGMSKICGLVAYDSSINLGHAFERMYEATWDNCYVTKETWIRKKVALGHFSIGAVNLEQQPIFNQDNNKCIIFAGKIFDYESKRNELIRKGYKFNFSDNDAEFVMNLFEEYGMDGIRELNGLFTCAIWDKTKEELILINDRYGLRPLFYFCDPAKYSLVFSSDIRGIIKSSLINKNINWTAWNIFLYLGFLLGNDTFFKNVYALPPASVLTFNKKTGLNLKHYWNINDISINYNVDYNDAVRIAIDLFQQAVHRTLERRNHLKRCVFLSGGQDSRAIAAELKEQGLDFKTFTTRKFELYKVDPELAKQIAKKLGVDNYFIDLPNNFYYKCESIKNELLDYESDEHTWLLPLVCALPNDIKINYDGIAGGIILKGAFLDRQKLNLSKDRNYNSLSDLIVPQNNVAKVFNKKFGFRFQREEVLANVQEELKKFDGNPNQVNLFYFNNRTRREVSLAPFKIILIKAESFCPYLDNDFFKFVMSLPPEFKILHKIHESMINTAYPYLQEVPFEIYINKEDYYSDEFFLKKQIQYYNLQYIKKYFFQPKNVWDNAYIIPRLILYIDSLTLKLFNFLSRNFRTHPNSLYNIHSLFAPPKSTFYDWLTHYF